MGMFSWCLDDGTAITSNSAPEGALPVAMIDNKNNRYEERDYEGYGVFGGMDYYDLVVDMNPELAAEVIKKGQAAGRKIYGVDIAEVDKRLIGTELVFHYEDQIILPKFDRINGTRTYNCIGDCEPDENQGFGGEDDEDDYTIPDHCSFCPEDDCDCE